MGGTSGIAASLSDYRLLLLDGTKVKWGAPALGTGASLTYAVVATERHFDGARNCGDIGPVDRMLSDNGIARALFDRELRAAVAAWSAVANVTFTEADPASADILIGAEVAPRGRAFTNVAYDHSPAAGGVRQIGQSVICLNPTMRWKIGFDGDLDVYDLRYTLTHELGHAIGLDHPSGNSELMGFRYLEQFRTPQPGDVEGVVALYGPPAATRVVVVHPATPGATRPATIQPALGLGKPAH